jgi:hypothetical protein
VQHDTRTTAFVSLDPDAVAEFAERWSMPAQTGETGGWPLYAFAAPARAASVDDPAALPAPDADWFVELSRVLAPGEAVVVTERVSTAEGRLTGWSCHALTADGLVHTESGQVPDSSTPDSSTPDSSSPAALLLAEARAHAVAERHGLVTAAELVQGRRVVA